MAAMSKRSALSLYKAAHAAGLKAAAEVKCRPMIVADDPSWPGCGTGKTYVVEGGVCGFAWVNFPANTSFTRALKAAGIGRKDSYAGGWTVNVFEHGQSMARKEAHAGAMASVLQAAGVAKAYSHSRID